MAAATPIPNEHSDLRFEHGALIFPMPVACYDRLMDSESLPRGSSYNGPRGTLEVDAVPNGRYHDPRTFAVAELLTALRRAPGVPAHGGATAPIEGRLSGAASQPTNRRLTAPPGAQPTAGRDCASRWEAAPFCGADSYTPVSGPVLSEMRSTFTPTFSSRVRPRFMNGVCIS